MLFLTAPTNNSGDVFKNYTNLNFFFLEEMSFIEKILVK